VLSWLIPIGADRSTSTPTIVEIHGSLFARKDNIVIFVSQDGDSCDDASHLLAKDNKVLAIKDATLARARVIKQRCRYLIALIVKTKVSNLWKKKPSRIKFTNIIRFQNRCGQCVLGTIRKLLN